MWRRNPRGSGASACLTRTGRRPGASICGRQPRPPGEVLQRCRLMAREIPPRQFSQRLVAAEDPAARYPFIEQHERLLLSGAGTEADETVVRAAPQDVQAAGVRGGDAGALEQRVHV